MVEGDKAYIYKVDDANKTKKEEIKIGDRSKGYIEVIEGLNEEEKIVAEGLKKVRPNAEIKPIIK